MKYIKSTLFFVAVVIVLPIMAVVFAAQSLLATLEEAGTRLVDTLDNLCKIKPTPKVAKPKPAPEPTIADQQVFEPGMGVPIDIVRYMLDNADMQKMTDREHTDLRKLMNDTMLKSLEVQFCSFAPQEEKGGAA